MKKSDSKTSSIIERFKKFTFLIDAKRSIENGSKRLRIKHLHGSSKALFVTALHEELNVPILLLCGDNKLADEWFDDLSEIVKSEDLSIMTDYKAKSVEAELNNNLSNLIDGLNKSLSNDKPLVIATSSALIKKIPKPTTIQSHKLKVKVGDKIDFLEFTQSFMLNGFQKEVFVSQPGEIAVRGGIVDIFPIGFDNPLRLEFWDDEIESIREFEPLSQRSIRQHTGVEIIDNLFDISASELSSNMFEYLRAETLIIIDSIELIENYYEIEEFLDKFQIMELNSLGKADIDVRCEPQKKFASSVLNFRNELKELEAQKYSIVIASSGKIHLDRLKDLVENTFATESDDLQSDIDDTIFLSNIAWLDISLSKGFELKDERFAYFTEHEIFSRQRVSSNSKSKKAQGLTLKEIKQLQIGDFVVHEDKGVGKFDGFQTIEIAGNKQDSMRIIFAEGDLLYVHLNYIHKVQKYSGGDGAVPKLTKLGSGEWLRKKARAKRKLKDIARELIKLYAERKSTAGYAFPVDDIWQKEFEASFFYEDTLDQARTTQEVKKDMESNSPMDRLICGDVGFGKTEIAIRASFKAATAGKQTAVLVPTTILAQQHFSSFNDRIGRYPAKVEVLSRFKKKNEQADILKKLKEGKIDIIIGTHRMLSKDVEFKNLGLLIIDEEHRFGVAAKEKLRQLKANVDTLTLTATPIPRTLNFSLMGARDLSLIETAPRNRLPVETEIIEFDYDYFALVIEREIARGGQVFFVNDKITGLEKIAADLSMKLPNVKYGIAHGQMSPAELEKVMEKFVERKIDILFATKIIESGIDIPNANTMIINNANNFGLAELYQLRGRVGRADIQAHCYLSIQRIKGLPRQALQRLQAIEEFTDLGSGLKLSMRDLEIRGAGNLLGAEQSGFIVDMGFELFQKILDEAVGELRSEEFADIFETDSDDTKFLKNEDIQIDIGTDAYFPDSYIDNSTDRFTYYKRLYSVANNNELSDLVKEVEDRFGKMPKPGQELLFAVRVRLAASETGFERVVIKPNKMVAEFPSSSNEEYYRIVFLQLVEFLNTIPNASIKQVRDKLYLNVPLDSRSSALEILWKIKNTIQLIVE